MKKLVYNDYLGDWAPPLTEVSFVCETCRKRRGMWAVNAYLRWGVEVQVGTVVQHLTRKCTRVNGAGESICNVIPQITRTLRKPIQQSGKSAN